MEETVDAHSLVMSPVIHEGLGILPRTPLPSTREEIVEVAVESPDMDVRGRLASGWHTADDGEDVVVPREGICRCPLAPLSRAEEECGDMLTGEAALLRRDDIPRPPMPRHGRVETGVQDR